VYFNMSLVDSYLYLELKSIVGDCDLYLSQKNHFPTFDDYQWLSTTCGSDSVSIQER